MLNDLDTQHQSASYRAWLAGPVDVPDQQHVQSASSRQRAFAGYRIRCAVSRSDSKSADEIITATHGPRE